MIALGVGGGAAILSLIFLVRLFAGPTLYDRALAANCLCVMMMLACAALGTAASATAWIDVAFAVSLATIVLSVAAMKFFRTRSFQAPMARREGV